MTYFYRTLEELTIGLKISALYEYELKNNPEFYRENIKFYYTPNEALELLLDGHRTYEKASFLNVVLEDMIAEIDDYTELLPASVLVNLYNAYYNNVPKLIDELYRAATRHKALR